MVYLFYYLRLLHNYYVYVCFIVPSLTLCAVLLHLLFVCVTGTKFELINCLLCVVLHSSLTVLS